MNCFNHAGVAAVGICKHCCKAVCRECCTDTGVGLACTESCVTEVKAIGTLITRNIATTTSQRRNAFLFPAFSGFMGVFFFVYGMLNDGLFGFPSIMGIGFLIFSAIYVLRIRAWIRHADTA